ncbi:MAG: hypothetical protein QM765_38295 [Myxococcales bacterium]
MPESASPTSGQKASFFWALRMGVTSASGPRRRWSSVGTGLDLREPRERFGVLSRGLGDLLLELGDARLGGLHGTGQEERSHEEQCSLHRPLSHQRSVAGTCRVVLEPQ